MIAPAISPPVQDSAVESVIVCSLVILTSLLAIVNISDGINGLVPSLFLYSCIYYLLKGYPDLEVYFQILIIISVTSISIFIIPNFLGLCFLGNSGSYFVSILISLFYMELYSHEILEYSDILLIFYIPFIDGLRVTFKRIINKTNPFKGDLTHIHHLVRKDKIKTYLYFLQVVEEVL